MSFWSWLPPAPIVDPFPGFNNDLRTNHVSGVLAGAGTFDLPGPDPGYTHRVYSQYNVYPASGAPIGAPGVSGSFNGTLLAMSGQTATYPNALAPNSPILASGEFFRLSNGSANGGIVYAPYFDIAAPNWTVVRVQVTAALTTLIPAPTSGFRTIVGARFGTSSARNISNRWVAYNADTIAHNIGYFLGGSLIARNGATINAGLTNIVGPVDPTVTPLNGPLQAQVLEAIATNPILVSFTYATFA